MKKDINFSYISDCNEQDSCDSHVQMVHLFKKFIKSGLLVSKNQFLGKHRRLRKKCRCALEIYSMNVLLDIFRSITYCGINEPGYRKSVVDGINATKNVI